MHASPMARSSFRRCKWSRPRGSQLRGGECATRSNPAIDRRLRKQERAFPVALPALKDHALVESGGIAGPELDRPRDDPKAAPERRALYRRAIETAANLPNALVERRQRSERGTLL